MELQPGLILGHYEVEEELGRGGMATVFRVRHTELASLHALKVLHVPGFSVQDRLMQEGRAQASLRHPNIVAVTDVVDVGGLPGLILEYIDGPNLAELIEQHSLTLAQIDAIARGIIAGVAAAHDAKIVHRDLKPENVLLQRAGKDFVPKVADFGLVKALDTSPGDFRLTRTGVAMGTAPYMAPEQCRDASRVDHRADIFSLGAVLYELCTGSQAFHGNGHIAIFEKTEAGDYIPPQDRVPALPAEMADAIVWALEPDVDRRAPDASALLSRWVGDRTGGVPRIWATTMLGREPALPPLRARASDTGGDWEGLAVEGESGLPADPPDTGEASPASPAPPLPSPVQRSEIAPRARRSGLQWILIGGVPIVGVAAGLVAVTLAILIWWNWPAAAVENPGMGTSSIPVEAPAPDEPEPGLDEQSDEGVPEPEPEVPAPSPQTQPRRPVSAADPAPAPLPIVAEPAPEPAETVQSGVMGRIFLNVLPKGAGRVEWDGKDLGKIPIERPFPIGQHDFVFVGDDGSRHTERLRVYREGVRRFCWNLASGEQCP